MPITAKKTKVAVLVSGTGTNLQAIIDAQKSGLIRNGELVLVVSSNPRAYALQRAYNAGIPTAVITSAEYHGREAYECAMIEIIKKSGAELIVLAGFMAILGHAFIEAFRDRIINVHPSLIPAFCGKGFYGLHVHEAALAYGVKVTGATVHYVNQIPDGGRIILQKSIAVRSNDTPESLQKRVMQNAEWKILPRAVEMLSAGIRSAKDKKK